MFELKKNKQFIANPGVKTTILYYEFERKSK